MRIAILSCFYPYRGGIAQFNASLYAELGKGHDVRAFNFKRQYPGFLFPGKTQYVSERDEAAQVPSEALLDTVRPLSWERTARKIRAWGPDLLVLRYWMPWFAPSLGWVARRMAPGCKVVAVLDNVIPHERHWFDKPLTRWFLSGCDGCITLCSEVAQDLLHWKPDARFRVAYHPLYTHFGEKLPRAEAEQALGLLPGKKNLLFFGLIRPYKGLDILLKAFDTLPEDYQLIIAGEPYGSFQKYQELIDVNSGKDRIHVFPGYIRDSEVKRYFSAADLTVLPYRSATQSGVSSVSYHFDVPMIVTDTGGLRETIGARGTGLVASHADEREIASLIQAYFADPATAARCREHIARERERLSWKRFCEELINFARTEL